MSNGPLLSGAVTPAHGAAAAAFAWRAGPRGGQLRITVIAKSTFAFAQGAEMTRVAPLPIFAAEVHHDDNPARSIRYTTDRVPYLRSADVLFTGTGYASRVRIGIFDGGHGGQALLDKTLTVREDGGEPGTPILYERAYGGMTVADNPLGTGAEHGSQPPFVLDPNDPSRPAGFGPIARYWPERKHLLGGTPRKALDAPIAEIPDGFDWGYFQASPRDQRIRFLHGDEWLVLDGLHPTLPRVQTRLPGARGLARVHGLAALGVPEGHPLDLYADLLHIDGDDQRCTVVWRNSFAIAGESALNEVRIVAGVELRSEPIAWAVPAAREPLPSMAATAVLPGEGAAATVLWQDPSPPIAATALPGDLGPNSAPLPFAPASSPSPLSRPSAPVFKDKRGTGTFAVSPDEEAKAKSAPATPFGPPSGGQPPSPPASTPAAPPPSVKDRRGVVGTMAADTTVPAHDKPADPLPFHASSAPSPMAQPSARPAFKDKRGTGTFAVSDDEAIARGVKALPFMAKAAEAKEEPPPQSPLPAEGGAPNAEDNPPAPPPPAIDLPPPQQAAPAPSPKPAEPPRPKEAQWAPQPAAPPPPPKPAPVQIGPTAATAAPKRGLYDRFNKR